MLIKNRSIGDLDLMRAMDLFGVLTQHGFGLINLHGIDYTTGDCTCRLGKHCTAPGKHPYRKGWQKRLASTEAKVNEFLKLSISELPEPHGEYTHYIRSNFGVACGMESQLQPGKYLVIVDIDHNDQMIKDLDACKEQTVNYYTGSGGKHYLYLADKAIHNSVSSIAAGVDIRGIGGYAVIPPSTNIDGDYGAIGPSLIIRELPEFIRQAIETAHTNASRKKSHKSSKHNRNTKHLLPPEEMSRIKTSMDANIHRLLEPGNTEIIPCGMRNQTLFVYLTRLRGSGMLKCALLDAARELIATRFEKPETFSETELLTLATSVAKYKPNVHTHDEVLRVFVAWVEKNKNWPESYGNDFFQYIKDVYRHDRVFFQEYLPAIIQKQIRTLGMAPTMSEVETIRADYYANLGIQTCHYPRYPDTLIGKFFKNEYPFYKVFDKQRNGIRRYEWHLLEDAYNDYLAGHRKHKSSSNTASSKKHTFPTAVTSPDVHKQTPPFSKSLIIPETILPWGILRIGTNCSGDTKKVFLHSIIPHSPPENALFSGLSRTDLTMVVAHGKVRLQPTNITVRKRKGTEEFHVNEKQQQFVTRLCACTECGDRKSGRFCPVNLRGSTLLTLWPTTDRSCLKTAWSWASMQRSDNEACSLVVHPCQLSAGDSDWLSTQGHDHLWNRAPTQRKSASRACPGRFKRCRRPCIRECGLCCLSRRLREMCGSRPGDWFRQSSDYQGSGYYSFFQRIEP